ncbi:MAG: hypothetical protein A3D67_00410 [Candidatus Lloydbacteria bacterium RIFCSPHIGHO2_02_FULL_51_22]|uniref:PrkA AAA domain-containing protein n=3 Tax=Candidatus Lloydiibacteriota TaxID=1817910 RepID=A0A1G2DEJ9_9BACT|nr:MAG: hypothetical protein A3D67_00410 [Candidatus Lloydbacteria bacterium RIFCSPHIGHO2_02_FULL_51_22]OGZ14475.1 MAG: hypothetical protein A3J08_04455 [Candidatus Lloydbacteria bacterium RIFCSPLOWO2_02_FULL_51_11]OGZ17304.1 MAG: hypothetical protein A3G11_01900 [Candidatus Lloydbacteria bacterium RIFCSPLOWO2_12_FULL_51_9]
MSETGKGKVNVQDLMERDLARKRKKAGEQREMTFQNFLEVVMADPLIAQNSPARILEMVEAAGTEDIKEHERWLGVDKRYSLFSSKLFGVEKAIAEIMNYLRAGANRLSTGKQILLLVGPTASGKSTFAGILKRALENYALRPVYAIKGCPMHEDPLHLLPRNMREDFTKETGITIEGDLCPHCRLHLEEESKKDGKGGIVNCWEMPVELFRFSIQGTRGIGSFEPSDEKSSDVSELVGRENIAISSTKGADHPLAWSLSGELEKANRGICEARELIKAEEKLLWIFISVAEEKELKVQGSGFPHISVDTVVIGHTNLTEYRKFAARQENEALHDRIYVVPFPYPLRIKEEVAIYKKLITTESNFVNLKKCHIAPGALEIAAIFAVLTRLVKSKMDVDTLTKLKLYNGDKALTEIRDKEKRPIDLRELLEEGQRDDDIAKREGMFGVSSRDVLAALNMALVEEVRSGKSCLTPLKTIRALRDVFHHRMGYTPEEVQRFMELLSSSEGGSVMTEYKDLVKKTVSRAFLKAYSDLARELFRQYIAEIAFHRSITRKYTSGQTFELRRDEVTGKPKPPDIKLMRAIEAQMNISDAEADTFRGEVLEFKAGSPGFSFDSYDTLARACENKLLHDARATLLLVLDPNKPKEKESEKRIGDLFTAMEEKGHCSVCAKEFVEKAHEFLSE